LEKHTLVSSIPSSSPASSSSLFDLPKQTLIAQTGPISSSLLGQPPSLASISTQLSALLATTSRPRAPHFSPTRSVSSPSGTSPTQCQICHRFWHTADQCYKRFDQTFRPPPPRAPPSQGYRQASPRAHFAQSGFLSPQANFVHSSSSFPRSAPEPVAPPATWFVDSGATSHITPDLNSLSSYSLYEGPLSLQVGNGQSLPISHIGTAVIFTSTRPLLLTNVLCVPNIAKPLLSISQLLQDNPVTV
jgi:hypothetical protein